MSTPDAKTVIEQASTTVTKETMFWLRSMRAEMLREGDETRARALTSAIMVLEELGAVR